MTRYRFVMLDSPPEYLDADDCRLEESEKLALETGEPHVMSWVFYKDGKAIYELPVRMVFLKPMAEKAARKVNG